MFENFKDQSKNLFSFYIICGDFVKNKKDTLDFLKEKINFQSQKNSDFYYFDDFSISMERARQIKKINSLSRNNIKDFRIFFIKAENIEEKVQNALLKTFEEPQEKTIFFLFLKNKNNLLDTLKSRAIILEEQSSRKTDLALEFLKGNYLEREKIIEKIIEKHKNEKEMKSQKTKKDFLNLFSEIDNVFLEQMKSAQNSMEKSMELAVFYKKFLDLKSQAKGNGSGIKNIFTYLAIFLPRI